MDYSFLLVGGSHWLNLLNTRYMSQKEMTDVLEQSDQAEHWLLQAGLLSLHERDGFGRERDALLPRLRELRSLCLALLQEYKEKHGLSAASLAVLQRWLDGIPLRLELREEPAGIVTRYRALQPGDQIVFVVIRSLLDTLQQVPPERIRICEHPDCVLHFADTSKGGKRRWCSMETCGNRHKAAEFYARKKANTP